MSIIGTRPPLISETNLYELHHKVVEKTAPEGFVLNEEAQTVTFSYKDQKTPVIEQTAAFENDRQKVEVSVVKQDAENETVVAGAEFGLY